MKSIISTILKAVLLFYSFSQVAKAQSSLPVIERQPYRILYNAEHDPVGEWPPIGISPPRVDASSLVNIGCAIDLRIVASGPDLTYQWKKGTVNIPGANSSQLYINVTSLNDAGLYRCEVSNPFGSVLSLPVRMGVVNIDVGNHFVAAGPTASLSLTANYRFPTSTGGFQFRWYRMLGAAPSPLVDDEMLTDGGIYTGSTKATLRIRTTDTTSAGRYYCMITAYNTYMLTGLRNLAVVPSPEPALVQAGAPLQFAVVPVGPAHLLAGLAYQWFKDGSPIPDAEDSVYAVASAAASDGGLYSLSVTHPSLGIVNTLPATALVVDAPVSHVLGATGGSVSLLAPPLLNRAQTLQWFRNNAPLVDGGRFRGVTQSRLNIAQIQAADAGDYECRGTLYGDTVVTARPVLVVLPAPQSEVVAAGAPLELRAQPAYGGSENVNPLLFGYQWTKSKGPGAGVVAAAASQTLNVATAGPGDHGEYSCMVAYNGGASLATPVASVAVVDTTPLIVNANAGRSARLVPVVHALRGVDYAWSYEGSPLSNGIQYSGAATSRLRVNEASPSLAGDYECTVSYPGGSGVVAALELVVYSAPEILSSAFPAAIVGSAFSYQIEVSGDPLNAVQSYDARPLPRGLAINKLTGQISGTPIFGGSFNVVVSARNDVGVTTRVVPLTVGSLPDRFRGRYLAALPRMPAGEFGQTGGRLDMTVTSTAQLSGRLTVGATSLPFAGALSVSGTDPLTATASATVTVPRAGGNLTMTFDLLADDYLHNGQITGAGNTLSFEGWRASHSQSSPPTALAGVYNLGLTPPPAAPPPVDPVPAPRGFGFASLTISGTPPSDLTAGNYSLAGRLADDTAFTCTGFVGPGGELLVYRHLYAAMGGGSILSSGLSLAIDAGSAGNPVAGELTWTRPASSARLYKDGFGPLTLNAVGGLYVPEIRFLSATQGQLTFEDGGIDLAARVPNAVFNIGLGDALPIRTAPNSALTAFNRISLAAGSFSGSFTLADDNPTTVTVDAAEYRRVVRFTGLVVPVGGQPLGMGFFILPQIPTLSPPTTTSNSPELSGNLQFEPVVN